MKFQISKNSVIALILLASAVSAFVSSCGNSADDKSAANARSSEEQVQFSEGLGSGKEIGCAVMLAESLCAAAKERFKQVDPALYAHKDFTYILFADLPSADTDEALYVRISAAASVDEMRTVVSKQLGERDAATLQKKQDIASIDALTRSVEKACKCEVTIPMFFTRHTSKIATGLRSLIQVNWDKVGKKGFEEIRLTQDFKTDTSIDEKSLVVYVPYSLSSAEMESFLSQQPNANDSNLEELRRMALATGELEADFTRKTGISISKAASASVSTYYFGLRALVDLPLPECLNRGNYRLKDITLGGIVTRVFATSNGITNTLFLKVGSRDEMIRDLLQQTDRCSLPAPTKQADPAPAAADSQQEAPKSQKKVERRKR